MNPTATEEAILQALIRYHYLTVDQVMLATNNTSLLRTQQRLLHLVQEKYIWRISRSNTDQNLRIKPAYAIAQKTKFLFEQQGMIVLPPREPSKFTLDHNLIIADILIRINQLECLSPEKFKIIHSEHDRDLRRRKLNLPLVPDGFFELVFLERKRGYPILIEVDNSTEVESVWKDKIFKYLSLQGKEMERVFDYLHPRTLCVATGERLKPLKRWTEEVIEQKGYTNYERLFYFSVPPPVPSAVALRNEEYRKVFVQTAAEQFFLTPHFFIGGSDEPVSLFDW